MSINRSYMPAIILVFLTIFSGLMLSSSIVSADDTVVDNINITVPISCTLSGVGMNSHNATINPGTYDSSIGETTIKAICNDGGGFAIYAIGYTDDTDGNNTLKSTDLTTPITIPTGTGTSGNSQWAMKLATQSSPTPTYPITIQNNFGSFHTVPESYTLVAKRTAGTDVGANAVGSTFTTTYQVYISSAQIAGTYVGKVKYIMVHPGDDRVPLTNDLTGKVLRFDEHPDVIDFVHSGNNTYELNFAVKLTVENFMEYLNAEGLGVTTWSQAIAMTTDFLEGYGYTNVVNTMQVIDENQNYVYMNYVSLTPTYWDYSGVNQETIFYNDDYNNPSAFWSHLPVTSGSLSFTDPNGGETVTFNSFEELMLGMFSGAWRGEAYYANDWSYDFFKTIIIYGGNDATNASLISWLSENTNLLRVNEMQNTAWKFNDIVDSGEIPDFNVSGQVYNNQYQPYNYSGFYVNYDYGVPIWTFYYSNTTAPYVAGDGFVYITDDLYVPAYGIDYTEGWYFGNSNSPTQYTRISPPIITLSGGDDLVNPSFIDWLNSNATKN